MAWIEKKEFIDLGTRVDFVAPATEKNEASIFEGVELSSVLASGGEGVYASADVLFKGAVFGRDSLEVGHDLLNVKPELTHDIILTMAKLQGVTTNETSEEERGRIHHEMRRNKDLDSVSQMIFDELTSSTGKNWGKEWDEEHGCERMVYFGSVDATALYVELVGSYCEYRGDELLDETVSQRDGNVVTVRETVNAAIDWLDSKLAASPSGLVDYKRVNPQGIENQVWKDSREFYVHTDGMPVNHGGSVASIEVQGITYNALKLAARLLPERTEELLRKAEVLRTRTIELLWLPDEGYFALGVDQDPATGEVRVIKTKTANPACLLEGEFFEDLPEEDRRLFVSSIVKTILSPDFLTDAGIRSRALSQADLVAFWDYHGSYVTWPKETYDVIKGLRHQGFPRAAEQVENRLLNAVRKSDNYPEFIYVDQLGRVLASQPRERTHGDFLTIDSTNKPEATQAWTISAVMAVLANRLYGPVDFPEQQQWQRDTDTAVIGQMTNIPFYNDREELEERYPDYAYCLVKERSGEAGNFLHIKVS
jgi:glycogen debranching enzyme